MGVSPNLTAGAGGFRIRTITAGVPMRNVSDLAALEEAVEFLKQSRQRYEALGYEVQTVRVATQPLAEYSPEWLSDKGLAALAELDRFAVANNLNLSVGPVLTQNRWHPEFAAWVAELIKNTRNINMSLPVASAELGVHRDSLRTAAAAVKALADALPNGEGNFRFAATAFCTPGTPFFPAGYHQGKPAFSIGLESPNLLKQAFTGAADIEDAKLRLQRLMETALTPVAEEASKIAASSGKHYWGIDVSPAPGPDASIGEAIEILAGAPFGSASTLAACAAITDVLKSLNIKQCGYSGLMLPVLEDRVLAQRAAENRYAVSELLLYSSVCGTGLDVVPLAGDTTTEELAALIGDMAALATKYSKPLSARLLPLPGLKVGDLAQFDNPYLVDSVVMKVD